MPRRKKHYIPLEIAPIQDGGFHCFIQIKIHGRELRMLLDTGASRSVFDLSLFKELAGEEGIELNEVMATGLGSSEIENFVSVINEITIGELIVYDYMAGLLDLTIVNQSYMTLGVEAIGGVIGSDLLVNYHAIVDFKRKQLTMYG